MAKAKKKKSKKPYGIVKLHKQVKQHADIILGGYVLAIESELRVSQLHARLCNI
jgi:hypothetical protein